MSEQRSQYRVFCQQYPELPIFLQDWWLDAVCGKDRWDVVVTTSDRQITGVLPFYIVSKRFLKQIVMPPLTQHMGPWLNYPQSQKYTSRLSFEKSVMAELIEKLPKADRFVQNFSLSITNWLPFYWKNFSQTTFYTYRIPNLENIDQVWSNLRGSVRSDIRKAEKHLICQPSDDIHGLYQLTEQTYHRQGKVVPYTKDFITRVHQTCSLHEAGQIFYAVDSEGSIHAALYLVWDQQTAYYLIGGANPNLRTSGAQPFLVWNAIRFASERVKSFDFEGSMHPAIERSFSAFGGLQTPYFNVSRVNARWLKIALAIK